LFWVLLAQVPTLAALTDASPSEDDDSGFPSAIRMTRSVALLQPLVDVFEVKIKGQHQHLGVV
jgi:hypothetical protein